MLVVSDRHTITPMIPSTEYSRLCELLHRHYRLIILVLLSFVLVIVSPRVIFHFDGDAKSQWVSGLRSLMKESQ